MQNMNVIQTNFTSGEMGPRMFGRVDVSKYYNGVEKLENFLILPQGGIKRRSGTRFVSEVKDSSKYTIILPFQFSTSQAYILELGEYYIRFYMNEAQLISGTSAYEIVSPWQSSQLDDLSFTQSADVLFIAHPIFPIKKVSRTAHTSWSITDFDPQDGPWLDPNTSTTTLTPSATSGTVTITASTSTFKASDVGRLIRIMHSAKWGCAKITAYTDATHVTAVTQTLRPFLGTTATTDWRMSAWGSELGYPEVITFHKERLYAGCNLNRPQTIWSSMSGDFERFSPSDPDGTVKDSSAINYLIATDQVNAIRWLMSAKSLAIGTTDAEFNLGPASAASALSPTNINVSRESTYGSAKIRPIIVGSTVLFTQRSKRKIYEYGYDYSTDSFKGSDLTLMSDHITRAGIKQMVYSQQPNTIAWCVIEDGSLAALTYLPEQKVFAWGKHIVGGTDVKVESIASIASPDGTHDQLWLVIRRKINGEYKRYIEFMEEEFEPQTDEDNKYAFFLDSGLTYDGTPVESISGLDHLIGETVSILVDGATHPDKIVDESGSIELDRAGSVINIGLHYESKVKTLPIEINEGLITQIPQQKRIYQLSLRFYKTLGGKYGNDENNLKQIYTRKVSDKMDEAPPLFSGVKILDFDRGWDRLVQATVLQDRPLPMTILSIISKVGIAQ